METAHSLHPGTESETYVSDKRFPPKRKVFVAVYRPLTFNRPISMCRLCDQIAPICAWKARQSFEAYCAGWPDDAATRLGRNSASSTDDETPQALSWGHKEGQGEKKRRHSEAAPAAREVAPAAPPPRLVRVGPGVQGPAHRFSPASLSDDL